MREYMNARYCGLKVEYFVAIVIGEDGLEDLLLKENK